MDLEREQSLKLASEEMKKNGSYSPIEIIVMGGFAMSFYCANRYTIDIDYLDISPIFAKQVEILESYNIDNRMTGMLEFDTSDIEIETKHIVGNITYCVPTIEWLTLSKLTSRRGKDLHDLKKYNLIEMCDKEMLVRELKEILTYKFDEYTREWNFREFALFDEI